jgi:hypothetical protein
MDAPRQYKKRNDWYVKIKFCRRASQNKNKKEACLAATSFEI